MFRVKYLRPLARDRAKPWAKQGFCTHNLKNCRNGLLSSVPAYGRSLFLARNFPPKELFLARCAKSATFRPKPPRRICLGGTFPPHFRASQPHNICFEFGPWRHPVKFQPQVKNAPEDIILLFRHCTDSATTKPSQQSHLHYCLRRKNSSTSPFSVLLNMSSASSDG